MLAFPVIALTFVFNFEPLLDHANPECENFKKKYQPTLMSLPLPLSSPGSRKF
jgi:hypothetical protein